MTSDSETLTGDIAASCLPVFTLDRELRYTAFNRAHAADMKALYGVEIALGGRLADYQTVAVDRETAQSNLMRALAGDRVVASAYSGEPGGERYIDVVHVPLTDASGEVIGVEVRAFDATDRQAIETALWESEGRYRDLFDSAVEGIAETSMEGNCLRANEAVAKMLGYGSAEEAAAEIVDSAHQVWADPDERSRFAELIRSQGTVLGYECRFVRKDGERIWVSLKSRSVPGLDGEATYYKSFVEDITERKRVEDALRKSEAHYRRIFETAAEGICVMGSDHRMTLVNRRMADMLGYEPADIVGKKVESFMFEEDLPAHQEPMTERQAGLDGTYEHRFRRSDGSILLTNVSATVLTDGPGDFAGSFAMFTDITERKRAEDLLRRSEVMRNVAEHVARTGSWRWDLDPTGFSWSFLKERLLSSSAPRRGARFLQLA